MFINGRKIYKIIDSFAPFDTQANWDNSGFQIGNMDTEVDRILIALDLTEEVVDEAIDENVDLIITHHPLIFPSVKNIRLDDPIGKLIIKLIKEDIGLLSAHTNLDSSNIGINNYIAELLNVSVTDILSEKENVGIIGTFDKGLSFEELNKLIRDVFNVDDKTNIDHIKYVLPNKDIIYKKIAICSGEGTDFIEGAKAKKADVYITGDVKHHLGLLAQSIKLNLIDVGHYSSEAIYMKKLNSILSLRFQEKGYDVKVLTSKVYTNPFQ